MGETATTKEVNETVQNLLANSDELVCYKFASNIYEKADELEDDRPELSKILSTLGWATQLNLRSENRSEPYQEKRLNSIPEDGIAHLEELKEYELDCEILARIKDLLWVMKKDHEAGLSAIDDYLESADRFDRNSWVPLIERIERALRLSMELNNVDKFERVIDQINDYIEKYSNSETGYLTHRLIQFLERADEIEQDIHSPICRSVVDELENKQEFDTASDYCELLSKIVDDEDKEQALERAGDNKVNAADKLLEEDEPNYAAVNHKLRQAINFHRRVGGKEKEIEEIHDRLIDYQKRSAERFAQFSESVDGSEIAEQVREGLSGLDFEEAIFDFAKIRTTVTYERLRKVVEENAQKFFHMNMPTTAVTSEGRVTKVSPSLTGLEKGTEKYRRALEDRMHKQARFDRQIHAQTVIEPGRRIIVEEHNPRIFHFRMLVNNCPFVPRGREKLFAKGLLAGLKGDLMTASHFLIPQIENSLRYALDQRNIITSGLSHEGVQEERGFGWIWEQEIIKQILDEDIVFDLKGLLTEKFGSNLRHRMAHGLLDSKDFMGLSCQYL